MTKTSLLGAAAILAALTATPALAQHQRGAYAHHHHGGFWPGAVAAGVVGGAIGTAAAIASSPYRGNSYAYYGSGPQYDDSYAYYGNRRGSTTCGLEPYATYMGPDGRWYPC
ncbi:MAG: hypothetical protein Q7T45_23465 [Bradyrhizobium sp.]|uniref:hypothetical protein n=1 Tax=Bradyrhizobium sp. TaxID=376 RepID=UPI0027290175|nr:hypothetical protein [Bradyrhizobium sp.]MDO8400778.1 hypothetical protein [Bradyrhizobium sp.]